MSKTEGGSKPTEVIEDKGRTEQIVANLKEAHARWKSLPQDQGGVFNAGWLRGNGYSSVYRQMLRDKGVQHFIDLAGQEVAQDFQKSRVHDRTPEVAIQGLRAAHAAWKAKPQSERGAFTARWLIDNGYGGLYEWMRKNGGTQKFTDLIGGELAEDFEVNKKDRYTKELVIEKLKEAYAAWKGLSEGERDIFNARWLTNNGYGGLYNWTLDNGGLQKFVDLIGGELGDDFEVSRVYDRIPEVAIQELRAAHAAWKSLSETERGIFNVVWLQKNGYNGLNKWMTKNGGVPYFVNLAGDEVAQDFEVTRIVKYTPELALQKLKEAHAVWKGLSKGERGKFNYAWLQKNGHGVLYAWIFANGGLQKFVDLIGGDLAEDFEVRSQEKYTKDSALQKLKEAHAKWKAQPENQRGDFNVTWLAKAYRALSSWMIRNGGTQHFIYLAGDEVAQDFEVTRIVKYTPELAVQKLKEAHIVWKKTLGQKGEAFNVAWLQRHKYSAVYDWMRKNGGTQHFVDLAGGEIAQDFEYNDSAKEKQLKQKLIDTVLEIKENEIIRKEFQNLISIFGASRWANILSKFRPEFKGLPVEYIKSVIADYLGDFLLVKGNFNPRFEVVTEYLSDLSLQEGVYETIKDNGLRYYYEQRKGGQTNSQAIIYGYLNHILELVGHLDNKTLDDIIQRVVDYYDSMFRDFHKPEQFVDELNGTREFPDVNQRINMKELADKKRLLIGDEMGMGKSASVIMAKEKLGVQCAVVIAPANVIHTRTWQKYLSDHRAEGGYFKEGEAPRVLVVDSAKDLKDIITQEYDYILISQERMDEEHTNLLEQLDYDMLIVDEVHKVKALEGKRAANVITLAEKIQGENKYVALLSGTPIPNKVEDIAVALKMLYPDKLSKYTNKGLASQIINGDVDELCALLFPRMQMKTLEQSVEMPELTEEVLSIELGEFEREVYEVLLEEDELTAIEKMALLRRFLLNPEVIDPTPNIESTKITELSRSLQSAFKEKDKVVVFVNGYVEGILRSEQTILAKLGLPSSIDVRVIDGKTPKVNRAVTQKEFNTASHKMLLLVSGDTADVGIDFSAGEKVIFYNEPWTQYQKKQELGRVFRPGLTHALEAETMITKGTIEQGIHEYILRKYQAVEKLLRGIPITEGEKELLKHDEASKEGGLDQSVNPELAEGYFSSWDTLLRMFSYNKEIGEEKFREFVSIYGEEYANCYIDLGNRSYQANANRVAATILKKLAAENGNDTANMRILDLASGPEMLKQHIADEWQDRVFSIDINIEHFKKTQGDKRVVGSILQTPFASNTFDYVNLALAFHYTDFAPTKGKYARLQSLLEASRILKIGGKAVVSLIYSLELTDMDNFAEVADMLGFKLVEQYSGSVDSGKSYSTQLITLEKIRDVDPALSVEEISGMMTEEQKDSLKFKKIKNGLKDSRQVITGFNLNGQEIDIELNTKDQLVWKEEQEIKSDAKKLRSRYGGIDMIPRSEIINGGFVRLKITDTKYILFKKLTQGTGAVVVR